MRETCRPSRVPCAKRHAGAIGGRACTIMRENLAPRTNPRMRAPHGEAVPAMTDVVIAIDIGGTSLKCALVEPATGLIRHTERHPTHADLGSDAVADSIVEIAA